MRHDRLDSLLTALKAAPPDRDLSQLETAVQARLAERHRRPPVLADALAIPLDARRAALTTALTLGLLAGFTAAPTPTAASDFAVFGVEAPLTPLARLR
ncbi:hypothetical protein CCR85_03935 [Rhodothalassium salexigens]|uniref:hypothetical protein n=1 Tax=Rhodothalassium salexigens TaxID=1086 RepID=UPI001912C0AF|nr:hypothetical protein [Rhodothalassium salexigens]MBK5910642.1 hypothetical protein [Rhodothalassium salexigens]MBK5920577.1 hypothetical protein [Rhodothalassium salexigens]